jgi:plasmid stabilization system protein ParE
MTHKELRLKVIKKSASKPNGMGPYAVYTYLMRLIDSTEKAKIFMKREGYSKTEITNALHQRKRDIQNQKKRIEA